MGRVVVAGSINMDVVATAERHPRIGETVAGHSVMYFPGGKGANQAVSAAKLGAPTSLIGRLGRDAFGEQLRAFLASQGIDLTAVKDSAGAATGTALITLAKADNTIVVIPGANAEVSPEDVAQVALTASDVAVSQFEIPQATIVAFFRQARAAGATTILNPAPASAFDSALFALIDVLVLNETELGFLTGIALGDTPTLPQVSDAVRALDPRDDQTVCVTLGARGAVAVTGSKARLVEGRAVTAVDTTGAGDCFVGALAARLSQGAPIADAIGYANIAASISVQRMGAGPSMPTAEEVGALL
ncbi:MULTISPECIES: ribokinase [Bradyrhizobium]|jgi:ribokinase|uniref:Ribokinase n=4 Tax=Bradyrhizobium TaxID=374 RepID=A0ABS5GGS7_9BRAD|nr:MULTISPECIES: ribokinase [Bradyrhizobium]RTL95416.1 MAG: ribokinase [Bradyrhizobiaceae bacterium]ABQ34966.1 ribokinase [Bradyrhizobium sp. BTAi1]MBR1140535.1 ribokinase [Bradyrhizobium denitrificans]MCL8484973.1 ribokinase [Bradyrhizobium denitrificans]MDU1496974.1 ribokinase [Bradyrhizobium sp.]